MTVIIIFINNWTLITGKKREIIATQINTIRLTLFFIFNNHSDVSSKRPIIQPMFWVIPCSLLEISHHALDQKLLYLFSCVGWLNWVNEFLSSISIEFFFLHYASDSTGDLSSQGFKLPSFIFTVEAFFLRASGWFGWFAFFTYGGHAFKEFL